MSPTRIHPMYRKRLIVTNENQLSRWCRFVAVRLLIDACLGSVASAWSTRRTTTKIDHSNEINDHNLRRNYRFILMLYDRRNQINLIINDYSLNVYCTIVDTTYDRSKWESWKEFSWEWLCISGISTAWTCPTWIGEKPHKHTIPMIDMAAWQLTEVIAESVCIETDGARRQCCCSMMLLYGIGRSDDSVISTSWTCTSR